MLRLQEKQMMNKTNKGIASMLIILFIAVAIIAGIVWYFYQNQQIDNSFLMKDDSIIFNNESNSMLQETSSPVITEEISTDTSLETIEAELDATIVGSPETEIDAMGEDASTL